MYEILVQYVNQSRFEETSPHLRAAIQGQKFQRASLSASLRNGRDSDLKQIEKAFKDFEDGFSEKNSSESIVGNSEVY